MKLEFMKIKEYSSIDNIECIPNSLFLHGNKIDDRSEQMVNVFLKKCKLNLEVTYQNETNTFLVNSINNNFIEFKKQILDIIETDNILSIFLEATSLGYTEILQILLYLSSIENRDIKISILYAEPLKYTKKVQNNLDNESYELSEDYHPHKYIKPFLLKDPHDAVSTNRMAMLITFIGFEENRLGRVIEKNNEDDNKYNDFVYVMPVPGFKFGWENVSLSKHYHLIDNYKEIHYAPADDPYETYRTLEKIIENNPDRKIVIMPLGTKPCTIGASIFLVNKKTEGKYDIATKFDFPIKSKDRTTGISKIFEYRLKLI